MRRLRSAESILFFTVGEQMSALWQDLPGQLRGMHSATSKDLVVPICSELRDGDVVMVKGSLGTKMKTIVDGVLALGQAERST